MEDKKLLQAKIARWALLILAVLFFGYYFLPTAIKFSVDGDYELHAVELVTTNNNGEVAVETKVYRSFTEKQREDIIETLAENKKMRRFGTEISDARIDDFSKVISIFVIPHDEAQETIDIYVSEAGDLIINNKDYRLLKSKKLVNSLESILATAQPEE